MGTSISDSEECSDEYDKLLYQASQQYEEEAEQLLEERYQHMQEDSIGLCLKECVKRLFKNLSLVLKNATMKLKRMAC